MLSNTTKQYLCIFVGLSALIFSLVGSFGFNHPGPFAVAMPIMIASFFMYDYFAMCEQLDQNQAKRDKLREQLTSIQAEIAGKRHLRYHAGSDVDKEYRLHCEIIDLCVKLKELNKANDG